jgi:hypothetical protein
MKEDVARKRLDEIIDMGNRLHGTATRSGGGRAYIPDEGAIYGWVASSRNLTAGVVGQESQYFSALAETLEGYPYASDVARAIGILQAFRDDWDAGLLVSRELLITADAFEGFLERAEYLLSQNYKDAAAVLIGGVLEATLRKMCGVRGIEIGPREAIGTLNDKLAKQADPPAYSSIKHKEIIARAELRHNAAHAHYDRYNEQDVADTLKWVREFAARHLA